MLTLYPAVLAIAIATAPTNEPRFNEAIEGSWDAHFRPSIVQLNVRLERERVANFGRAFSVADLTELRRDRRAIGFELRRAAGTFRFDGTTKDLRASGTFSFIPSTSFKRSIEKIGLRGVERHHMLTMALYDVSLDDLRMLQRTVYGKLTIADVSRMLEHGATPHYIRDLSGVGFGKLSPLLIIRTRDRGVDADYVRGLRAIGLRDLTLHEYMRLREHDVTAEFASDLFAIGYTACDIEDLIRLRDAGITAGIATAANKMAGELLSIDELIRSRSPGDY